MGASRLDPDELALLEEERDHLLTSLRDLEREHDAGDMDDVDYETLRDGYTRRAAEVLGAIDAQKVLIEPRKGGSPLRVVAITSAVVLFAVLAGVLVARSSGQRGGGAITGAVNTDRARMQTCRQIAPTDTEASIGCFDAILEKAPDNVEALTYRGWALIRADRVQEGAADLQRAVEVDPDYPDARVFRAIVASRAGDHALAAQEIDRFYRNNPSPEAISVLESQGLEREIFIMTINESTRGCWTSAAQSQNSDEPDATEFAAAIRSCLEQLLEAEPDNVDAMVSLAYVSVDPDSQDLAGAAALAERAVAANPQDPNALLLRASLSLAQANVQATELDLAELETLPRPTASFLFGGPERLRAALDAAAAATTTTAVPSPSTTAAPQTTTTAPVDVDSRIPNPGGG